MDGKSGSQENSEPASSLWSVAKIKHLKCFRARTEYVAGICCFIAQFLVALYIAAWQ